MVESPLIALAHKHDHELISRSRAATVPGGRESSLGCRDISFGTVELITHHGEIVPQQWRARPCISRGVSDIDAAGCSDNHQAFSRRHPRGRRHGVPHDPMPSCEISIRRESCTRAVLGAACYVGAQSARREVLGGFARVIGHILSVHTSRLKTLLDVLEGQPGPITRPV